VLSISSASRAADGRFVLSSACGLSAGGAFAAPSSAL
jgi:hypothetical protein